MLTVHELSVPLDGIYLGNPYLSQHDTGIIIASAVKVQARVFIEFGVNKGLTAQAVLKKLPTLQRYIGVDVPADHKPILEQQNSEIPELAGVYATDDPRFQLLIRKNGTFDLAPSDLPAADIVFIDGDHSSRCVVNDSLLALSVVRSGGLIIWHDYGNPEVEVTATLDKLVELGWPICHIDDTWFAVLRVSAGASVGDSPAPRPNPLG